MNKKIIALFTFLSFSAVAASVYDSVTVESVLKLSGQTATTVPYLDASKNFVSSAVTPTELGYLSGVTSGVQSQLGAKEGTITATTSADYYRGDKTFQTLDSLAVVENTNLYFTDARARAAAIASSITDGDLTHAPDGNSVFDALALKEPNITATTSADYYRGDKTFQPFNAAAQSAVVTQVITNGVTATAPSEDAVFDALALKQSTSEKDQNNGYAGLDAGGKIAVSALPNTVMTFEGQWNANTNTPALADGVGNAGDVYRANVAGTTNFGSGPIAFNLGDWAVYNGTVWEYAANSNLVMSVNGQQGVVVLDTDDIAEGTNLYFTEARVRSTPLTGFTSGAGTVAATDTVLQAIEKLDGNINAATTKTPDTLASFDGSGNLQSHPNWNVTSDNNFNLNDSSNSTSGYTVMSANKTGDVSGGATQGYNFFVNGNIDGYYGFNSNLQGTSSNQVEHITLNSSQTTTGNYFMINGNMTGDISSGGIYGLNMAMGGDSDNFSPLNASNSGDTGYINGVSLNNTGDVTNGITGFNMGNSGASQYISALNYSNTGSQSGGYQIINIQDSPTSADSATGLNLNLNGTYSTSVSGISINVNSATSPQKAAITADAGISISPQFSSAVAMPPSGFAMNYLGGSLTIANGFPLSGGEFGFGNNLATVTTFNDDMGEDATTLNLGYSHVGFVGQVDVAAGKTVADMNMALGGGGVTGSGGTITDARMFHAVGFLNQGGSITVDNMHGFYTSANLCAMSTDCWSFFDDSGTGENYMGRLAVGTASKKNTATFKFDVLGDSKLDGALTVTGIATLGNGSTATTQSANDNSTKIATTAYVDSAIGTPVSSNITANTTLSSATKLYFADTTGGAFTVTLPAASTNDGVSFTVKHVTFGGANDVTVAMTGGDTIEGAAGDTLTAGDVKVYISNGTNWYLAQ